VRTRYDTLKGSKAIGVVVLRAFVGWVLRRKDALRSALSVYIIIARGIVPPAGLVAEEAKEE
jgi:hypothetical protein